MKRLFRLLRWPLVTFAVTVLTALALMSSAIGLGSGCNGRTHSELPAVQDKAYAPASAFLLTIAADRAGITMAHRTRNDPKLPRREFYVLLSNVSKQPQTVWEDWNSWGYQTISFEITTAGGTRYFLSKRRQAFTRNFPSTVLVEPGEHVVYPVQLDQWWE